ncbi:hypothetical protein TIFTF001_030903 [Ficus carica]|uniref:Uncharacterized protein n=1 Tax=Ficus carica TaxID=3494 RepID=A0AA88DZF7_FICCA|nr:hypothetical protein TIFTF001_030903 [Ficus carica]
MAMQKVQHRLYWDALEISADKVEDTAASAKMKKKSCSFEWVEHVGDIGNRSLVGEYGQSEIIESNAMHFSDDNDDEDDQGEMFDDLFYSCSSFVGAESLSSDDDCDSG